MRTTLAERHRAVIARVRIERRRANQPGGRGLGAALETDKIVTTERHAERGQSLQR